MARVNDEKPPVWTCGQCKKTFTNMNACVQHQENTGHGDIPACLSCKKPFPNEQALMQHQQAKNHAGVFWVLEEDAASSSDEEACAVLRLVHKPENCRHGFQGPKQLVREVAWRIPVACAFYLAPAQKRTCLDFVGHNLHENFL